MPASTARNKESLIMEIIIGTCIPRATRLVTSRPSALHRTKYFPQGFRHIEIVGFTDDSKEKFANIAFKTEPNVLSEFKKFIFSNPIIKSLMYIPVNCAILAQSYKDIMRSSKQVPKTITQLYSILIHILIRRHLIAIGRWDEDSKVPSDLKDLPEDLYRDLERVSELAYTGLFEEDIQLVFTESDVGEGFHSLGLLSEVKEMYVCEGARTSYSFLHLSIHEFLAAWHVSCHQELVEEALAQTLCSDSPHLHVFGRILAGLIGINAMYMKYLIEWYKSGSLSDYSSSDVKLYACHCLYEAQNNTSGNVFNNFDDTKCPFVDASSIELSISLTTPLDMYVFGYCLACVPHQWLRVNMESSIDMLLSSLADHASANEMSGSIKSLWLDINACLSHSSKLVDLPKRLLGSIKDLVTVGCRPSHVVSIGKQYELPCLAINIGEDYPEPLINDSLLEDVILSRQNSCLKSLMVSAKLSEKAAFELTKAIANNSTIEVIDLYTCPLHDSDYEYRMDPLAQAALSCPSLKDLTTWFPFVISHDTNPLKLQSITLCDIKHLRVVELARLLGCLYSISDVCKVSPIELISFNSNFPLSTLPCDCVGGYYDCISLLNICLHHHWPFVKKLRLPFSLTHTQFHLSSLSRALRRDPDTSQLKLRRSKSLSDLVHLETLDEHARKHPQISNLRTLLEEVNTPATKTESCPDLVGIQLLHPFIEAELFPNGTRFHP